MDQINRVQLYKHPMDGPVWKGVSRASLEEGGPVTSMSWLLWPAEECSLQERGLAEGEQISGRRDQPRKAAPLEGGGLGDLAMYH